MKKSLLALMMVTILSMNVSALEPNPYITDSGIQITPFLETGVTVDDNIHNQSTNELDTSIFTITPYVNFLLDDGVKRFELDLGLESVYVDGFSEDNYRNGYLNFTGHVEQGSQSRWDISAGVRQFNQERGTGLTEGNPERFSELLNYDVHTTAARYEYGALSSSMRIAVDMEYYKRSFNNFVESTDHLDFDNFTIGATFYYSTNSKTSMFLEVTQSDINYGQMHPSGIARDSDDTYVLVGMKWEATAILTGSFRLGQQQKSFTDLGREDFSGLSWDLGIEWQPLTYSSFLVNSSKRAKDPYVQGDYINETSFDIVWRHRWSDLFDTRVELSVIMDEYSGQSVYRTDDYQMLSFNLNYALLRWMDVSLFTQIIDNDSTTNNIMFKKIRMGVNFTISI